MEHEDVGERIEPRASRALPNTRPQADVLADPRSLALLHHIDRVAPSDAPVLITGETGTGKEVIARRLHARSRRTGAFVAVNCGALSEGLAEAELFGHQAGAFTGARVSRPGWFEAADGGTLLLDEIGDLPLSLQVKLLRVVQEGELARVGSNKTITVNVRLAATTNIDLEHAVSCGRFRADLYYRLNVVSVIVPPLRVRRGDILPLAEYFLRSLGTGWRTQLPHLQVSAQNTLLGYTWPGNVRELQNVIHSTLLGTAHKDVIDASDLNLPDNPPQLDRPSIGELPEQLDRLFESHTPRLLPTLEEMILRRAFVRCRSNQLQTARLLGISRNALRRRLKRFGILRDGIEPPIQ